jgi:prolyl oligopeptidase
MRTFTLTLVLAAACGQAGPVTRPTPPTGATAPSPSADRADSRPARTVEVEETRFGVSVSDPYRWMEGDDNPELKAWLAAQGKQADAYLEGLPGRRALQARVHELANGTGGPSEPRLAGGRTFYLYIAPGEQLPKLMVRDGGRERVLVDTATRGGASGHASLNNFAPSLDGRRVAYNLASGGGEVSDIHVVDVASGKDLPDVVERVWGELPAGWLPDGSGFFYTQMAPPRPGVDPLLDMRARLHLLGAHADRDLTILGHGVSDGFDIAANEIFTVEVPRGTRWLLARVSGARSEDRYAVAPLAALDRTGRTRIPWRVISDYADATEEVAVVHEDRLYFVTYKGAPNRRLLSVPLRNPDLAAARIEIAEDPRATIINVADAKDALYVKKMVEGRGRLYRWPWRGAAVEVPLPFDGWVDDLVADPTRDGALLSEVGWTRPTAFYVYDTRKKMLVPDELETVTNADYAEIVADEVAAQSSDGTQVPLSILHRNDAAHDAPHPAMVYGYGGYGWSLNPSFAPARLAWLERGGILAICHTRGGGEKGHDWQAAGTHDRKMNGIHDFEACALALIEARLSDPRHLCAQGRSAGGILVGRAITDRPDLFAAANIGVGMVNPLRMLAAENGRNQIAELGDPETEAGFKAIHEIDPYQHVTAAPYPAMLFTIGLNDKRVAPWMTAKMAARMQARGTSGKPVLIRVEGDAGHGFGSTRDQTAAEAADVWSFCLAASGDPAFRPAAAAGSGGGPATSLPPR